MVKNFAEEVIKDNVGKNWAREFVKRYNTELKSIYLRNMDRDRMKSEYAPVFKHFYDLVSDDLKRQINFKRSHCMQLSHYVEKYHLTTDVMWNWDEKDFVIGQASIIQRIMSLEAFESGRITHASQDGSREFISLLACISANDVALPPALIIKGEHLQDSWLEDLKEGEEGFFTSLSKRWSSHELGHTWLTQMFDRCTKKLMGCQRRRLLIVNGHSSHVNMTFINTYDQLNILLLILSPHSTHRLQSLDVSLFSPLATYYMNDLNKLMFNSLGIVSMSKRMFWTIFRST